MNWIIGDVHGMIRPLLTLLRAVETADALPRFIFAGDIVNRGADSREVVELLMSLPNAAFVRGNHDDIFDQVLNNQCYSDNATRGDRIAAFQWFMKYGLDRTLMSYGADIMYLQKLALDPTEDALQRLVDWVPPAHRQFMRQIPPVYETSDFFVVHGKWDPDDLSEDPPLAQRLQTNPRTRHRLLWGRYTDEEIGRLKAWRRTGYFGHTAVSFYSAAYQGKPFGRQPLMLPIMGNKMVLVDTAAALGVDGRLTAFCHESRQFVQAGHFGQLLDQGQA